MGHSAEYGTMRVIILQFSQLYFLMAWKSQEKHSTKESPSQGTSNRGILRSFGLCSRGWVQAVHFLAPAPHARLLIQRKPSKWKILRRTCWLADCVSVWICAVVCAIYASYLSLSPTTWPLFLFLFLPTSFPPQDLCINTCCFPCLKLFPPNILGNGSSCTSGLNLDVTSQRDVFCLFNPTVQSRVGPGGPSPSPF